MPKGTCDLRGAAVPQFSPAHLLTTRLLVLLGQNPCSSSLSHTQLVSKTWHCPLSIRNLSADHPSCRSRTVKATVTSSLDHRFLERFCMKVKVAQSCPTLCDTIGPYSPWDSPGQNTGVGSLSLLQGVFPTQGSNPGSPYCGRILYQLSYEGSL